MNDSQSLNPLAEQVWTRLGTEYPAWKEHFGTLEGGDLEIAVPAPPGSKAGHLVIFTAQGNDIWIRFSPAHMCYAVSDLDELFLLLDELLDERALFVVITRSEQWEETTMIRPGQEPHLEPGQEAQVVSWSGKHDRIVTAG